jgi:hypothetical protein
VTKRILLAAAAAVFTMMSSVSTMACDERGVTGIMPENDMRISALQMFGVSNITEAKFNSLIDRVVQVYGPIVQQRGGILKVNRLWKDETVNASASRSGKNWILNMYGGLARHQSVTEDGFMLVVCHELGHQIGGAPKYDAGDWAANEGQADYFGAMKCMRRVLTPDDNASLMAPRQIDPAVKTQCDDLYRDNQERALCARVAMAGKSLANLFASTGSHQPNFNTPDKSVVTETYDSHPAAQCRLDTYFQAASCTRSFNDDVSETDAKRGVCIKSDGFKVGMRPLCWYKPEVGE